MGRRHRGSRGDHYRVRERTAEQRAQVATRPAHEAVANAGSDRSQHRRLERQQSIGREEASPVLAQPVVTGARHACVDHMRDSVADRGVDDGVPGDDLVVLAISRGNQQEGRDATEVEAVRFVEVQTSQAALGSATPADGGDTSCQQLGQRERGEMAVGPRDQNHFVFRLLCGSLQ